MKRISSLLTRLLDGYQTYDYPVVVRHSGLGLTYDILGIHYDRNKKRIVITTQDEPIRE